MLGTVPSVGDRPRELHPNRASRNCIERQLSPRRSKWLTLAILPSDPGSLGIHKGKMYRNQRPNSCLDVDIREKTMNTDNYSNCHVVITFIALLHASESRTRVETFVPFAFHSKTRDVWVVRSVCCTLSGRTWKFGLRSILGSRVRARCRWGSVVMVYCGWKGIFRGG
jgi:hypothetical protein